MHALGEDEFTQYFLGPMQNVTSSAAPVVDIWPYVQRCEQADRSLSLTDVEYVYRSSDEAYEHVLIGSHSPGQFLCVIVDRSKREVLGHRLLDMQTLYGTANQ